MSKDLDAIFQFLSQPNTDYAYVVDGAWGSGKTYFWKHDVVAKLRADNKECDDLRIAYVSLYGLKRPEEIRSAVLAQLHPRLATAGKLVSALGPPLLKLIQADGVAPEGTIDQVLEWFNKGKRLVICFDDLERVSLPIDVVLGQINQFVEHAGAKVIILCNEAELTKGTHREQYLRTKEKIVGITRSLSCDPVKVVPSFIAHFTENKPFHTFLTRNEEKIVSTVKLSGLKNLRSLKYALLLLETAHRVVADFGAHQQELLPLLLGTILPVALDLREGKLTAKDANELLKFGASAIFSSYWAKEENKPSPLAEFGSRYDCTLLSGDRLSSPAIAELFATGYLDADKFRAETNERNVAQTPGKQAVQRLLRGWFELSDEEVKITVRDALIAIQSGEIAEWESLYGLAMIVDWMMRAGVHCSTTETVQQVFSLGIEALAAQGKFQTAEPWRAEDRFVHGDSDHELPRWVRGALTERNRSLREQEQRQKVLKAFDTLEQESSPFLVMMSESRAEGFGDQPMSRFISADDFLKRMLSTSNAVRHRMRRGFDRRYKENHNVAALADDATWLEHVRVGLQHSLAKLGNTKPATHYALETLNRSLIDALGVLRQHNAPAQTDGDAAAP
jgi:hypothetical protein